MGLQFNNQDLQRIQRNISRLDSDLQSKVWNPAYRDALKPVRDIVSTPGFGFKDRTGNLRRSFTISTSRKASRGVVKKSGAQFAATLFSKIPPGNHAYLVHEGTSRGAKPRPYLRIALRLASGKVLTNFHQGAVRAFARLVNRTRRR